MVFEIIALGSADFRLRHCGSRFAVDAHDLIGVHRWSISKTGQNTPSRRNLSIDNQQLPAQTRTQPSGFDQQKSIGPTGIQSYSDLLRVAPTEKCENRRLHQLAATRTRLHQLAVKIFS